jgi:hypothetical protein
MPSQFLALVGVSLFDPETVLRSRMRETRRPKLAHMQSPISLFMRCGALSFAGYAPEVFRGYIREGCSPSGKNTEITNRGLKSC